MSIYLLFILYIKNKTTTYKRLHYIPQKIPFYECKEAKTYEKFFKPKPSSLYKKLSPKKVISRILIISNSKHQKLIYDFLNYFKVSIRVEKFDNNLVLEIVDEGRFSLIVFDDYRLFQQLNAKERRLLIDYCQHYNVGIISFYLNEVLYVTTEAFTIYGAQYVQNIQIPENSPVRFVGKFSNLLVVPEPYKSDWTLFDNLLNATSILIAEDYYKNKKSVAILISDEIEHIVIGKSLEEWIIKIIFLDSVIYMAPNIAKYELEK